MKECYIEKRFGAVARALIEEVDQTMAAYAADGYDLTLRQVYYYIISHCDHLIPDDRTYVRDSGRWIRDPAGSKNAEPNYKWIGDIINDARLAGLLDWDVMVDRTRQLQHVSHWEGPGDIVDTAAKSFRLDTRTDQPNYIELWCEKQALEGIVIPVGATLDVDGLVCRGFNSQSALYQAAKRFDQHSDQHCVILYLGDHDPSGIDMTRDIDDRLNQTFRRDVEVVRIALTMDQIDVLKPPPNPSKQADSRYKGYVDRFGEDCWEMDALDPRMLTRIIQDAVAERTNTKKQQVLIRREKNHKTQLEAIAKKLQQDPKWKP